ncbi:unnamed protein product, partial [Urochloa humidicola]
KRVPSSADEVEVAKLPTHRSRRRRGLFGARRIWAPRCGAKVRPGETVKGMASDAVSRAAAAAGRRRGRGAGVGGDGSVDAEEELEVPAVSGFLTSGPLVAPTILPWQR